MNTHAAHRRTRLRAAVAALGATLALALTACQSGGEDTDTSGRAAAEAPAEESAGQRDGGDAAGRTEDAEDTEDAEGNDRGEAVDRPVGAGQDDAAREAVGGGQGARPGQAGGTGDPEANGDGGAGTGIGTGEDTGHHAPDESAGEDGDDKPEAEIATCTDATTELAVVPVERPVNHLLLTATNTSAETCFIWYSPYLKFEDAQAPVQRLEASVPQAVVALDPGQTAYAAIITSDGAGEAEGGYVAHSLGVQLAGPEEEGVGGMEDVALPGGEVYIDSSAQVTYWHTSVDGALFW
ncbi:DUF4232 domain-containing protein [Streptomyces avicenniae]|uniref:DUF4232 domain-containing protein n=1 Tax=Streptomyces avicenniae TaxID=500153 RepID=UPI00069C803B|nr:DUF4232 domain-containing protein [Streptomyces avicenniae]